MEVAPRSPSTAVELDNYRHFSGERLVAAPRLRRTEISPFNRSIRYPPARVGVTLDVNQLICRTLVLCATTAAIAITASVEHRDDDSLGPFAQAEIVKFERAKVRERRHDIVRGNPRFRLRIGARSKLPRPLATVIGDTLLATWIGIGGVVGLVCALPHQVGRGTG